MGAGPFADGTMNSNITALGLKTTTLHDVISYDRANKITETYITT
jgi:hypothetical protein